MVDDENDRGEEGQQPAHREADYPADDARLQRALAALLHAVLQLRIRALFRLLEQPSFLRILVTHKIQSQNYNTQPTIASSPHPIPSHIIIVTNNEGKENVRAGCH